MKARARPGFTIVEILIVIVVIAILATITAVMYMNAQTQAEDLRVRDAADKLADSVLLFSSKAGRLPRGGWGSTTAIGAGTECADGAEGWAASGTHTCTVEDTLIASGYLPAGFTAKLGATSGQLFMLYSMGADKAMVFYSQEAPTTADTTAFNAELTQCGINPAGAVAQRDTYGMRGGICLQYK